MVSNIVPIRSEGRGQFHGALGNLRWDAVLICRKVTNGFDMTKIEKFDIEVIISDWHEMLNGVDGEPSYVDWDNMKRALEIANKINISYGKSENKKMN